MLDAARDLAIAIPMVRREDGAREARNPRDRR